MPKRLFVGSLPFDITQEQLQALFAECGQVASVQLISDKLTGRSKGFGFVEMTTDEETNNAIAKLNGKTVGARQIVVNEARPMEPRPRFDDGRRDDKRRGHKPAWGKNKRYSASPLNYCCKINALPR